MIPKTTAQSLQFSTIRLEIVLRKSLGVGTGFIVEHKREGKYGSFLITNEHVIEDAQAINSFFLRSKEGQPIIGQASILETYENNWIKHSDFDIAVLPLTPYFLEYRFDPDDIYFTRLETSMFLSQDYYDDLDAIENISFFGYPIGLWDSYNLTPIHRRGVTATPLYLDFNGIPSFLIDASVFPGSSGSPVYLLDVGGTYFSPIKNSVIVGHRVMFLGILSSSFCRGDEGMLRQLPIPIQNISDDQIHEMIDLGYVLKASIILDFLEKIASEYTI